MIDPVIYQVERETLESSALAAQVMKETEAAAKRYREAEDERNMSFCRLANTYGFRVAQELMATE